MRETSKRQTEKKKFDGKKSAARSFSFWKCESCFKLRIAAKVNALETRLNKLRVLRCENNQNVLGFIVHFFFPSARRYTFWCECREHEIAFHPPEMANLSFSSIALLRYSRARVKIKVSTRIMDLFLFRSGAGLDWAELALFFILWFFNSRPCR